MVSPRKMVRRPNKNASTSGAVAVAGRVGCLRRYSTVVFAVVSTAMMTRQLTMISEFHACDYSTGNSDIHSDIPADDSFADMFALSSLFFGNPKHTNTKRPSKSKPGLLLSSSSSKIDKNDDTASDKEKEHATDDDDATDATDDDDDDDDDDTVPSRAWKPFDLAHHPFPCYPPGRNESSALQSTKPCHEGILFQRPTKVGSTTMTNIVLRLAHNRGAALVTEEVRRRSTNTYNNTTYNNTTYNNTTYNNNDHRNSINDDWKNPPRCQYRSNHGQAIQLEYPQRNKDRSFLFSLVRDPTKRAISEFFHFHVSYSQVEPTTANFLKVLRRPQSNNALIRDLTFNSTVPHQMTMEYRHYDQTKRIAESKTKPNPNNQTKRRRRRRRLLAIAEDQRIIHPPPLDYPKIVMDILENYDFIAVMERMDESLVALKLLLGLTIEEILYVKASRSAGSFSNGPIRDGRPCLYLIPSFLTPGIQDFLYTPGANDRWMEYTKGDRLLHRAANQSLNRTIDDVFGRDRFETELREFQNAQHYANAICTAAPALVLSMCDDHGKSVVTDPNRTTTCYIWGEGCDHKCLNERVPHPLPREILEGRTEFRRIAD
jgi:hypothetical protein